MLSNHARIAILQYISQQDACICNDIVDEIGLGKLLLEHVISASEQEGIWTLQSGVFPTNYGSIKVHEATGFRMIGKRERVGKLHGKWEDNVLFERRSSVVGID